MSVLVSEFLLCDIVKMLCFKVSLKEKQCSIERKKDNL